MRKKIYALILIISILFLNFNTIIHSNALGTFDITLTPHINGYGSVSLNWQNYNYANKNFKVYKSTNNGASFETVGIDHTSVNEVKCLQVYPDTTAGQLKSWVVDTGYGQGIIKVTDVSITNFNKNPSAYLYQIDGKWNYDVVYFGTWDRNNCRDLSVASRNVVDNFIKSGKGVIFGHDTILCNSSHANDCYEITGGSVKTGQGNFDYLATKWIPILKHTYGTNIGNSSVQIVKTGLFTTYPNYIGGIGTNLSIPHTHTWGQALQGNYSDNLWLQFNGTAFSNTNNYYLITYNNLAHIQTGHSNGTATSDEQKILANLIFYMNQLLFNTYTTNDNSAQDVALPNTPTVTDNKTTLSFSSSDNGSFYQYYVESYSKDDTTSSGLIDRSAIKQIEVKTGLKSYRYIFDNSASTTVTLSNGTETTATSVTQPINVKYFHVAAVDNAGNISATKTVELNPIYTLTTNAGTGGIISSGLTIPNGSSTSVHIVPMSGYQISTLTVDGASKTPTLTYDFWNTNKSHTVTATFTKINTLTNYLNTLKTKYSWINW